MRCDTLGPRLSAWVDGELSWLDAWFVARHVASCPTCAAEVEEMRALNARLTAANPVLTPFTEPVRVGTRPARPLIAVGALAAAGIAGFFLLPHPQPSDLTPSAGTAPTPVAERVALASPEPVVMSGKLKKPETPAPKKSAPAGRSMVADRGSVAPKALATRTISITGASSRKVTQNRRAPRSRWWKKSRSSAKSIRRERPDRLPTTPLQVAEAKTGPMDLAPAMPPLAAKPVSPEAVMPELDSVFKKSSVSEPVNLAEPPPAAVAAERSRDSDTLKSKRNMAFQFRSSGPPKAITSAAIAKTREEGQENGAPRKRVVPVLVVTPTRYENVVTVTAGALEVDDTDNDEEETTQP